MKNTKFSITLPGAPLEDVEKAVVSQGETFLQGESSSTPPTKAAANKARLDEGLKKVAELNDTQTANGQAIASLDTLTNTTVQDLTGATTADLTDVVSFDDVNWAEKGLPDLKEMGIDPTTLTDLTGVDVTTWNLPKPALGLVRPDGCITLDDILDDLSSSLTCTDARDMDLGTMDFSDSRFDDYDWNGSPVIDRSRVPVNQVAESDCLDFSGIFDFSDVNWPELPDFDLENPFKDLDLSGVMDDLKGLFSGMGGAGDFLGLSMLGDALNGVKCVGKLIVDALVPDALEDAVKNFDIPDFDGGEEELRGLVVNAASILDLDSVIYYDKSRRLYNYTNLSQMNEKLLEMLANEPKYRDIVPLANSVRGHYKKTGG